MMANPSQYPPDFTKTAWQWLQTHWAVDGVGYITQNALGMVVDAAFQASLRVEEGRPVVFQIVLCSPQSLRQRHEVGWGPRLTLEFKEGTKEFSASSLVKIAPAIGLGTRWLALCCEEDSVQIVGIVDDELVRLRHDYASRSSLPPPGSNGTNAHLLGEFPGWTALGSVGYKRPQTLRIVVSGPGDIRLVYLIDSLSLRGGDASAPIPLPEIGSVFEWFIEAAQSLGIADHAPGTPYRRAQYGRRLIEHLWLRSLIKTRDAKHGGCFLVVPGDQWPRAQDRLRVKYPLDSDEFRNIVRLRLLLEPQLTQHWAGVGPFGAGLRPTDYGDNSVWDTWRQENLLRLENAPIIEKGLIGLPELLCSLTAVDGAVVLTRDLVIKGFGAVIGETERETKKDSEQEEVTEVLSLLKRPPLIRLPKKTKTQLLSRFGTRHRSAYHFCKAIPGAMAFVLSQDGDLRLFAPASAGNDVHLYNATTETLERDVDIEAHATGDKPSAP